MTFASVPHCAECGLSLAAGRPTPAPGVLLDGRYKIKTALGSGGMGHVFIAEDVHLLREVAVKTLHPGSSREALADFQAEARALASIKHPHITPVHSFGVHGSAPFFAMELVRGATLAHVIDAHAVHGDPVPLFRAATILRQLAGALGAAHAAGILHRDVKPENVIIEEDSGRPVLIDFGIASKADAASTGPTVAGTPEFMAPELFEGSAPSIRSDVYALGCLAYELLTNRPPFVADHPLALGIAHREHPLLAPSALRPEVEALDASIARALAKDPEARFPTVAAFSQAFQHALRSKSAPPAEDLTELVPHVAEAIRILVVDDDPVFARIAAKCAREAFKDAKVAVTRAKNGAVAVRAAETALPQLLLLDYHLPELDGVEVLSRIRDMPGGGSVSVLVMSGSVGERERWRFSILGVRDFVTKPVSFDELTDRIVSKGERSGWLPRRLEGRETHRETLDVGSLEDEVG